METTSLAVRRYSSAPLLSMRIVHPLTQTSVSVCDGLNVCLAFASPSMMVTVWSRSSRLVMDTAWAAAALDRSAITPIARDARFIVAELKGCTRGRYFFFFLAAFFVAFFAAFFFAFIAFVL